MHVVFGEMMSAISAINIRIALSTILFASNLMVAAIADDNSFVSSATAPELIARANPQANVAPQPKEDPNALINDALALMRANHNKEAAAELARAVELAPQSAEAHHNYALALAKLGDTNGAIMHFKKAIEIRPDLDSSWITLAGLHQSVGDIDDAIALYREFLVRFKDRPDLAASRQKITQLVTGLQKEYDSMKAARRDADLMRGTGPALSNGILQPAAMSVALDDYLAEATRTGVVRWPMNRLPITVYIENGDAVPNYKPQWSQILRQSFVDWEKASNGSVRFKFVGPGEPCRIRCMFVADPSAARGGLSNDAEAGEAAMKMDQDGLATGCIKILTKSLSAVLPLTDNRMRTICLHEIGHALGLAGHTDNPDDIMFYSTSFKDDWKDLTPRDARTIQRLYAAK